MAPCLLQLLGMDRLDINGMSQPDGVFDFVDNAATAGGTIHSQNGRIFFPSVEPFGSNLKKEIEARVDDAGFGSEPHFVHRIPAALRLYKNGGAANSFSAQPLPDQGRISESNEQ